jgi:hypothetical protein
MAEDPERAANEELPVADAPEVHEIENQDAADQEPAQDEEHVDGGPETVGDGPDLGKFRDGCVGVEAARAVVGSRENRRERIRSRPEVLGGSEVRLDAMYEARHGCPAVVGRHRVDSPGRATGSCWRGQRRPPAFAFDEVRGQSAGRV